MKTEIFMLFQSDEWKTKSSYVFFGAFDSFDKANQAAKDNELYHPDASVIIERVKLNEFGEN